MQLDATSSVSMTRSIVGAAPAILTAALAAKRATIHIRARGSNLVAMMAMLTRAIHTHLVGMRILQICIRRDVTRLHESLVRCNAVGPAILTKRRLGNSRRWRRHPKQALHPHAPLTTTTNENPSLHHKKKQYPGPKQPKQDRHVPQIQAMHPGQHPHPGHR